MQALLVIVALAGSPAAAAQAPQTQAVTRPADPVVELRLADGSHLYGWVESDDGSQVVFRTVSGNVLTLDARTIRSRTITRGVVRAGEFLPGDPNSTRLLFGPTARQVRRKEGYFAVYEFIMPFVQVGITDRLSVGAGTPLVFGGEGGGRPFWVTPKVQVCAGPRAQAAVGTIHFFVPGEGGAGIGYGVVTVGSDDSSGTFGIGGAYWSHHELVPSSPARPATRTGRTTWRVSPVGMVGGERRLSRSIKLMTENYVYRGGGILSGGVRFIGDRLSADVGLAVPLVLDVVVAFPVVNFVWRF